MQWRNLGPIFRGGGALGVHGACQYSEYFVSCSLKWGAMFIKILNGGHPGAQTTDLMWQFYLNADAKAMTKV